MTYEYRIPAASSTAFVRLAVGGLVPHSSCTMEEAEIIRRWMLQVLADTGWSARKWAIDAGLTASTVQKAVKPDYPYVTSSKTLAKLAKVAKVSPPDVSGSGDVRAVASDLRLPIRGEVGASGFLPRDEIPQAPLGYRTVRAVPPYQDFTQWLERVVNDSMDRIIPPGSEIHVVDAIELGYQARSGDVVVVERSQAQGGLVERTVKQVEITRSGVELWPRSHNPRWDKPIPILAGSKGDVEVRVVGLVIRSYQFFAVEAEDVEAA